MFIVILDTDFIFYDGLTNKDFEHHDAMEDGLEKDPEEDKPTYQRLHLHCGIILHLINWLLFFFFA